MNIGDTGESIIGDIFEISSFLHWDITAIACLLVSCPAMHWFKWNLWRIEKVVD